MSELIQTENRASFGGEQRIYQHPSTTLNCDMNFAIYLSKTALDGGKFQCCIGYQV